MSSSVALFRFRPDSSQRLLADRAIEALLDSCLYGVAGGGPHLLLVCQIPGGNALGVGFSARGRAPIRRLWTMRHGGLLYRRSEPVREETSARGKDEN